MHGNNTDAGSDDQALAGLMGGAPQSGQPQEQGSAGGEGTAAQQQPKPKHSSLPTGSLAGSAAIVASAVADTADGARSRRTWGLMVMLGGLVAAAVGGVLAAVLPEFVRLPAVALAGLGGVVAYVGLWALVLGDKVKILLEALTGKVTGQGCLIVFGSVAVPGVLIWLIAMLVLRLQG